MPETVSVQIVRMRLERSEYYQTDQSQDDSGNEEPRDTFLARVDTSRFDTSINLDIENEINT